MFSEAVALVGLGWYIFIALVCTVGYIQLFVHYRKIPRRAAALSRFEDEIPHITVIRPCKGYEPYLYECLSATFRQDYPTSKLSVYFCVASTADAAYSIITKVVADHAGLDGRIFVEDEDPVLVSNTHHLGPNPKIRNMSRAYREAKGDAVWIIDCNVWVDSGACGRMVDKLFGYTRQSAPNKPYKLVHHLPISVDVHATLSSVTQRRSLTSHDSTSIVPSNLLTGQEAPSLTTTNAFGGMLEELFLASSHAKMYVAINTVAVAPCIVGKSTMFRRSQLDALTGPTSRHIGTAGVKGIDFFSHNICEDHLLGDLLWKSKLPMNENGLKYKNHGLVFGDFAFQPVAGMSLANYVARRVRWLRVRKYTVPAATAVEPGTESFVCSLMGAWSLTTSSYTTRISGGSWSAMLLWFLLSVLIWAAVDLTVYLLIHSGLTIETANDASVPAFAIPLRHKLAGRRSIWVWGKAWLAREALALPIWLWAIWGGATVMWRERKFWVGMDMKVHEIDGLTTKLTTHRGVNMPNGMNGHNGMAKERAD